MLHPIYADSRGVPTRCPKPLRMLEQCLLALLKHDCKTNVPVVLMVVVIVVRVAAVVVVVVLGFVGVGQLYHFIIFHIPCVWCYCSVFSAFGAILGTYN